MKNTRNRSKRNTLDSIIQRNFSNLNKQLRRRDGILLDSGFYDTETWGGLRKCWTGYKIAKSEDDAEDMEHYAKGIRKFQRELKISVSEFPQFGLLGRKMPDEVDPENYWPESNSCTQTQKELEDYRLQELAEDPFRFQLEPDLREEQEEYFRRIRQEWMDPGSTE
jgi:hypothetical protein